MTIAVDASAIVAILLNEPEKNAFTLTLSASERLIMSPVGYWEAAIRIRQLHGDAGILRLDRLIAALDIAIMPASETTARLAAGAEAQFGKRTPAKLNLGDCFAYALAKESDAPLLFKGDDFGQTDLIPALPA
ncbi:type II toxin-antitoxin system VapC family toxin [Brevundimonas sp. G8]|uniref:type II toxin-antitoxin system VapC family toxin n=1 Tax=Brevundimonas sp. G8 TaxID=1350776 RepID=UPI0012F263B7|nr:type II toxin-antitoxin system VapC family toxin [Brevundimonas sp. G8]VXA91185.1 Ribonuclease VapC30 [Brevundimonas sp. G8]